jgi:hypothetical protein
MFIGDLQLQHIEWLLQRGSDIEGSEPSAFQNPDRWLGELGSKWRKPYRWKDCKPKFIKAWEAFRAENAHKTVPRG